MSTADFDEANLYPDLPRLTGTEKQIPWARDIRARAYPHMDGAIEDAIHAEKVTLEIRQRFVLIALECLEMEDAKWWIHNQRSLQNRASFHGFVTTRQVERMKQERREPREA